MDDAPRDSIVPMWKRTPVEPRRAEAASFGIAPRRSTDAGPLPRGSRAGVLLIGIASAAAALTWVPEVDAEGKTPFLTEQLRKHTDYRVRTSAAMSLGTSDDVSAVKPLCACLDDDKEVESVRISCAAALGKLKKPGADQCLKDHANDKNAKVKDQVASSLKALGGGASVQLQCPAPPAKGTPKYYVGVEIGNKTNRPDTEIKPLVEKEIRCKLQTMPRFKMAPAGSTSPKDMTTVVDKEKLDGWYLQITVDPIKYESGQVKVAMNMVIQTHTRDIKGNASRNAAIPGVTSPSKPDEDDLIKLLAEKLANDFAGTKP
jgi:hypothetical protein